MVAEPIGQPDDLHVLRVEPLCALQDADTHVRRGQAGASGASGAFDARAGARVHTHAWVRGRRARPGMRVQHSYRAAYAEQIVLRRHIVRRLRGFPRTHVIVCKFGRSLQCAVERPMDILRVLNV